MSSKSQNAIQLLSSKREPWRRKISWSSASAEIQRCSDNCFEAWPPLPVLSASCRTALQSSSIHNFNDEDERLYVLDNLPSFEFSGFKSSGIFWLSASWPWLGCITCLATVGGISRAVGHTIPIILKMVSENGIWGYPTLEKPILCFIFSWWTSFEVGSSGFVIVQIASFRRPSEILCNLPAKLDFTAWHIVPRQDDAVFTMDMKKTAFYRIFPMEFPTINHDCHGRPGHHFRFGMSISRPGAIRPSHPSKLPFIGSMVVGFPWFPIFHHLKLMV